MTGEMFAPIEAKAAGFFDKIVPADQLQQAAQDVARALTAIDLTSHAHTKSRLRRAAVEAIRSAIDSEITLEAYQKRAAAAAGPSRVKLPSPG